jgi:hypothetical protein
MRWWHWASLPLSAPLLILLAVIAFFYLSVLNPIADEFQTWWYGE